MPDIYEQRLQEILMNYRSKKEVTKDDLEQAVKDIFGVMVDIEGG